MRLIPVFCIFIFYIGKYLIQISGMERVHTVLLLRSVTIVLCINNQNIIPLGQHDIRLHNGKHGTEIIIQLPWDL